MTYTKSYTYITKTTGRVWRLVYICETIITTLAIHVSIKFPIFRVTNSYTFLGGDFNIRL